MREHIKASDISNQISMLRTVFDGTILVVEGITDARLYGKLTNEEDCEIIPAHSKENVRMSVREMNFRRSDNKVIGIMDADTDLLEGKASNPPLFITDARDAEMMLIKGDALNDVIHEYGEKDAIHLFEEKNGTIRDVILNACYPLGLLMYLSKIRDLGLSFKDLDFSRFINPLTLRPDIRAMAEEVIYNSQDPGLSAKRIREILEAELENELNPWIVCRGHDAVEVLVIGLRKIFGSYNAKGLRCGELAGALRLAYDMSDFIETRLYKETKDWCESKGMKIWITGRSSL